MGAQHVYVRYLPHPVRVVIRSGFFGQGETVETPIFFNSGYAERLTHMFRVVMGSKGTGSGARNGQECDLRIWCFGIGVGEEIFNSILCGAELFLFFFSFWYLMFSEYPC